MASLSGADAVGQRPNHDAGADATNDAEGAVWIYRKGVRIPDDATRVRVPASVTTLPDGAFQERTLLTEVELTEGLENIGPYAFSGCTSLRRVELPSTLLRIDEYAFFECESLTMVNLTEGLRYVGEGAFVCCYSLKRIELPSTLEDVCSGAFLGCDSLEEVTIMTGGILDIAGYVVDGCSSLDRITIPSHAFLLDNETVRHCSLVTDGHLANGGANIPRQTIIAPESLASIPLEKMTEIIPTIGDIINSREGTKEQKYERIRALINYHASIEVSTIIELALWKKQMAFDGSILDNCARVECRTRCGADAIMPGVLSYLYV